MVNKEYIRKIIKHMGYQLLNGNEEIWVKKYKYDYEIILNFEKETINYEKNEENSIIVSNKSTSNFSRLENFVVLECVDRLLEKGYKPNCIELEHSWPSGRTNSERLDILVYKDKNAYLMIECKTMGKEFQKEKNNMLLCNKNGESKGQLFSYCWEEKTTEYICLYASEFNGKEIVYENAIIEIEDEWKKLANKKEMYDYWNKSFKKTGIFENYIMPYNIETKKMLRGELEELTDETSSRIFNQFLEILRHNSVSDKPNAFNKVLNLFICKIVDEDRNYDEEVKFQWNSESNYVTMQSDLEDLYRQGMKKFLNIVVTDYSDQEIDKNLQVLNEENKEIVRKMFQNLRLQKNSEFAFKEVYNEESFNENAKVVKEIVELLQPYQFRYGHKQQFLGNFFELLLNTSIKQESGQFFTPVPIARFMISSLPLKEMIDYKVKENNENLLPLAIDYACGTGHFLTEYMDIIQNIINEYPTENLRKSTKNIIEKWKQSDNEEELQGEFEWAHKYVYGIEKDYRLVKATKISTFLNGDGEANIILADGLDKFRSKKYIGELKSSINKNEKFDILIANPPYSVSAFKQTLPSNEEDFELYNNLTENSSEIECLFVERAKQLLKTDGCAAIILPSSILNNSSTIYEKTREILLKNFYIKAISKMGPNTFMATGINTVILFLKKRNENDYNIINNLLKQFFSNYTDFSYGGKIEIIKKYVKENYDNIGYNEYIKIIQGDFDDTIIKTELYKELKNDFESRKKRKDRKKNGENNKESFIEFIREIEYKKLLYYILTFNNKTLILNTGKKDEEKEFLGYEFSNRRGYEGIHYYKDENDMIESSLYDDENFDNNEKVNYYINKAYKDEYPEIVDKLKPNLKSISTNKLLYIDPNTLDVIISTNPNYKLNILGKYESRYLKEVCNIEKGKAITEKETILGEVPVIAGGKNPAYFHNEFNREAGMITISASGANAGFVNYWDVPIYASDCTTINTKDNHIIKNEYIYIVLKKYQEEIYLLQKGQGQPHVYPDDIGNIKIPIPPIKIQNTIIEEYNNQNNLINEKLKIIKNKNKKIMEFSNDVLLTDHILVNISEIADISRGASPRPIKKYLTKSPNGVNWIKIGDVKPEEKYIESTKQKITKDGANKSVYVKPGDFILSNSMSFGRPYILKTDGCIHDGWLLINNLDESITKEYLYYILMSEFVQKQLLEKVGNGTTVDNLNIDRVKGVKIPIIESELQKKLVENINCVEEEIIKLKQEISEKEELKLEIIQKYI